MSDGKPGPIQWGEPPGPKRPKQRGSMWDPVAAALKARPGQWARIVTNDRTGVAHTIRTGGLKCFKPEGSFETRVTNHTERWVGDVYARYIGEHGEYGDDE